MVDAPTGRPSPGLASTRALRGALAGVRAVLLDVDGVLVLRSRPIPGSIEALGELMRRGVPYRLVTNASRLSRATLAAWLAGAGVNVPPTSIVLATSAAAAYTAERFPGLPLYVLATRDALGEFRGQRVLTHADAARAAASAAALAAAATAAIAAGRAASGNPVEAAEAAGGPVAAVVVGDAGDDFTFAHLDTAFRLVHFGARLVAMHRNPWWTTPAGPTLDSGAFVRGLEFATGQRAKVVGKPSAAFYRIALGDLSAYGIHEIAMVGDDLQTDIAPAKRLGLRTILVRTGRHDLADVERIAGPGAGAGILPDAVAPSLADVVAALR